MAQKMEYLWSNLNSLSHQAVKSHTRILNAKNIMLDKPIRVQTRGVVKYLTKNLYMYSVLLIVYASIVKHEKQ